MNNSIFSLFPLLLTTSFGRKRPHKRNNIIRSGSEQHTDKKKNNIIFRAYEQKQHANTQAAK
jgi:hypothetical protein